MRRVCRGGALVAVLALTACAPADAEIGVESSAIVGGTTDTGDPAVVLLYAVDGQAGFLCTASVISPRVLLTAAHCVSTDLHSPQTTYYAYLGNDFSKAAPADLRPTREVHAHPSWSMSNLQAGHDIGVVVLRDPLTVTPLPLRRVPLEVTDLGQPLRLVGYGASSGDPLTGSGLKRETQTPLDDFDAVKLLYNDTMHLTCNGDSGGPAFLKRGGVEEIAGITSFGDEKCQQFGMDTRVDAELAFVDEWLAKFPGTGLPPGITRSVKVRPAQVSYVGGQFKADAPDEDGPVGDFAQGGCAFTGAADASAVPWAFALVLAIISFRRGPGCRAAARRRPPARA